MGAALRIILIIVLAWYLIRFIDRYIAPALFGPPKQDKTKQGSAKKGFKKGTSQGDVTITDHGRRSKKVNPNEDDYIDYEEIK